MAVKLNAERGLLAGTVTFLATASAARMCGAPVVFADVDPQTGNVTPRTVAAALDAARHAIAAVAVIHLGGRPCDMPALRKLTAERGVVLIEDACHAPLATYPAAANSVHQVGACAHSDIAVLSFHPIKHVAMGEGGAVLTNDPAIADRIRVLRNHGIVRDPDAWMHPPEADAPWYYEMHEIGWNYRACEMQCALGISQLSRIGEGIARRRAIASRYRRRLSDVNYLALPPHDEGHVWHLFNAAVDFASIGKTRGRVMRELAARGVGTQVHYIPVHRQPYYAALGSHFLPGADAYYAKTLSLPMYIGLEDRDVDEIADAVRTVVTA
jgi:dTDP-4-amino-4,6-dideoxygalactose transaminase